MRGWEKGYDSGKQDAEDAGDDEEDDTECKCSQCTSPEEYDMGWSDGYQGVEIDPDLKDNEAYMDGYLQGRDDGEAAEAT